VAAVAITIDDRGVATLTIDHPPINLLSVDVFIEIAKAGAELAASAEVRAVVLRSANAEWFIAHSD
jgi:enoyl-CoA hydratase/carnithine racemase